MPPLYRMPVFYLLVLLLGGAVGLASWIGGEPLGSADRSGLDDRPNARADRQDAIPAEPNTPSDDGILRTSDGLRRKVLVRELGLRPRFRPDPASPSSGDDLDYYAIHFVFDEADPTGPDAPRFLQIGPAEGPPLGWVPESGLLSWNTRLMARPTPNRSRPPLVIYRNRSCLLDALAGRRCLDHGESCPIEGEEPEPATDPSDSDPTLGLPILSSASIPQPDGSTRTIFEVASLVADRAPPPPPPSEPPEFLKRSLRQMYLAVVIDTTASMQASIESARDLASELVEEATRQDVTLRLALVAYRDDHPTFGYSVRIVSPFASPRVFRGALDRIEAASRGDGTVAEAVLDGVAAALPAPPEAPIGSRDYLVWPTGREGDLATKLLVLIGDAPDHDRDTVRAEALADWARQHRITIAAVSIERDDLRGDEPERYRSQWDALASGSFLPRDRSANFEQPISPVRPSLRDPSALRPTLRAIIDDRVLAARELAALLDAEAEGRLQDYVDRRGLKLNQIAPVLVDLHGGQPRPEPSPDPRRNGQRAPSVRRGWIAEAVENQPLVTVEMLMTRPELDALIAELSQFQQALEAGADDLTDLLRIGTAAASGEAAFLSSDRGDRTFAEHLARRQGLPPAPPESLLNRSQADLLQADAPYRAAVSQRIASAIAQLLDRRQAPDWDDPNRTVSGMALVPYGPIDF
ncbi:vWA domain-containing protein [Tautonia marina]|uniref:vWA domain-containing protein n=1 Tax=Tautonia marina TaxID=2653855 RepID=UPI001260A2A2|nr:vWA domain-containing protein [Tautonia marina]